jgi:hypothetical protein
MRFPWSRDVRLKASSEEALAYVKSRRGRYRIHEVSDYLIYENPAIGDPDDHWKRLSKGQKALIRIAVFDAEINNGGVEQYLWNYPQEVFAVHDAFEMLGASDLARQYASVLDQLCEVGESWIDLRERFKGNSEEDLDAFLDAAELIEGGAFDSAYYGEWDGEGNRLSPGFGDLVFERFVDYFEKHQPEFIKSA